MTVILTIIYHRFKADRTRMRLGFDTIKVRFAVKTYLREFLTFIVIAPPVVLRSHDSERTNQG